MSRVKNKFGLMKLFNVPMIKKKENDSSYEILMMINVCVKSF